MHIIVGITGASGAPYTLLLLRELVRADCQVSVVASKAAHMMFAFESEIKLPASTNALQEMLDEYTAAKKGQLNVYSRQQWTAPIASGSNTADAMIVCPCTTGTLAAIATGMSDSLLERAADVIIKEHKKLVLMVREMPLSAIHLGHMLTLANQQVVIMPPCPGFYHHPKTLEDMVGFIVGRALEQLGIKHQLYAPWDKTTSASFMNSPP